MPKRICGMPVVGSENTYTNQERASTVYHRSSTTGKNIVEDIGALCKQDEQTPKLLDRPNVHRLFQLYTRTVPLFSHASFISDCNLWVQPSVFKIIFVLECWRKLPYHFYAECHRQTLVLESTWVLVSAENSVHWNLLHLAWYIWLIGIEDQIWVEIYALLWRMRTKLEKSIQNR